MMNKEIKIAIAVGVIMLLICTIIVLVRNREAQPIDVDIKIYKLNDSAENKEDYFYSPCSISTDSALKIQKEFNRANSLKDSKILSNKTINGNYKVISKDKFIAFDNSDDNIIYNGDKNKIYSFESEIFELIMKACG